MKNFKEEENKENFQLNSSHEGDGELIATSNENYLMMKRASVNQI